jgi:phosphatidylserine decarboxylase
MTNDQNMTYITVIAVSALSLVALGRKWQLKPRHYLSWVGVILLVECATLTINQHVWPALPLWFTVVLVLAECYALTLSGILYCFFRDPPRSAPHDGRKIVSPADGTIVYVKMIENGRFPFAVKGRHAIPLSEFADVDFVPDRGIQIGIAMNFLNVHVNRSPIEGTVRMIRRIPGQFASLKHIASLLENERVLMILENDSMVMGIVQIASRLVRRIVPYVQEGNQIAQGQRIGMIRFGSQVDVLIPARPGLEVVVAVGDEVTAGESVIVRCSVHDGSERSSSDSHPISAVAQP